MPGQTRTVIAAGAVAYGQGGDEVILLYSEQSIEHSRKVGGSAFAEVLVRLTKPLDIASTDQRAPDVEERLVDVSSPLVAHPQPSVAIDPRQRPLRHPPMSEIRSEGYGEH